jgi:hypothetical protein
MTHEHSTHAAERRQRQHRLRRIVAWVLVVVLGLTLTSVAFALTRAAHAQAYALELKVA